MRTLETFYKPGLEPPNEVIANLSATPRPVHAIGVHASIALRVLAILATVLVSLYIEYYLWQEFVQNASVLAWTIGLALLPVAFLFVPWLCVSSYRKRIRAFRRYCRIYANGIPVLGMVNTISRVMGSNHDCHFVEHSWTSSISKTRIDYTFVVENEVKTGTVIMHEQSARFLVPNLEIVVLYLPDNVHESMIYPIPGSDWFMPVRG